MVRFILQGKCQIESILRGRRVLRVEDYATDFCILYQVFRGIVRNNAIYPQMSICAIFSFKVNSLSKFIRSYLQY